MSRRIRSTSSRKQPPERIDPYEEAPGVVAHHATKYTFAAGMPGRDVLDVGCGFGYGTRLLKETFDTAIGVDLSEEAIGSASARYSRADCSFAVMDATAIAFRDRSFDLVTCFEVIEHLATPEQHLDQAARLLRTGGRYVVSTPRPETGGSPANNPFHEHEFTEASFTGLLRRYFASVELLTQAKRRSSQEKFFMRIDVFELRRLRFLRSAIRRLASNTSIVPTEDAAVDDFEISVGDTPDATEFVAVCSDPLSHAD